MEAVMHKHLTNLTTLSVLAVTMLANSLAAEAKSETDCRASVRHATGEIEGLDFEQALTGCMLDSRRYVSPATPVVIEETEQPTVALPTSPQMSSGPWVRVSPNRWLLRPDRKK
jgi:hypothetical protein